MKKIVSLIIGLFPFSRVRIMLLRLMFKYQISRDAYIGWGNIICCQNVRIEKARIGNFNRIYCDSLVLESGAEIRTLNVVKLIKELHLGIDSQIVSRNSFVGLNRSEYEHKDDCNILIGEKSLISINNFIDATRKVVIGNNVVIGGRDTQIWTHGFDINRNMITGSVIIGNDIYLGARCTICQGVNICDQTVVGAATCVSKSISESGFYVSNNLIRKSDIQNYSSNYLNE